MRRLASLALPLTLLASACTDANLYSPTNPAAVADRVAVTGRVCTDDPAVARFPIRIVLLVDAAAGPLFATFDPQAQRVGVLQAFVNSALARSETALAVVRYAGRSQKLAPSTQSFTRNPGELLAAISQLSIAEPCLGEDQCRDWQDGLRTARSLIEGDMAASLAGTRVLTQYVVLHVNAGPHSPLARAADCCAPNDAACIDGGSAPSAVCQAQKDAALVESLSAAVAAAGAGGLRYHTLHLAAEPDGAANNDVARSMGQMAFAGAGTSTRVNGIAAFTPALLDVLNLRATLRVKHLIVTNRNAKPSPSGPVADSDGDGLSDAEEAAAGTAPDRADTDGDGIGDLVEILVGFDPLTPLVPVACEAVDATRDTDGDGLGDCDEVLLGTDISLVDTDGDALPDREEVIFGTDYLGADAEADDDGDGISNGDEVRQHSDPRSTDLADQLAFAYRYEVDDEGQVIELRPDALKRTPGVEIVRPSEGTTAGVGVVIYTASTQTLQWRDAADAQIGPPVAIGEGGELWLPSSSFAPIQGEEGRRLQVRVDPAALSPTDVAETVRIVLRARQCLRYTVRNIRMMPTIAVEGADAPGTNAVVLALAEAPEDRLAVPGPFRLALLPIRFVPPSFRVPSAATLEVLDEEFVRPRLPR
jgi:hypothetical protein